jgi:type IV pilus assembly protein PilP
MNFRNCVIALTCVAVLGIGYLASEQAARPFAPSPQEAARPQRDASGSPDGDSPASAATPAARSKKRKKPPSAPVEAISLRDPFESPDEHKPQPKRTARSRLDEIDLSELRLVAVVRDVQGRIAASLEDPNGIGFLVRPGTAVGPHGGFVAEISPEGITIREPGQSAAGQASPQEIRLALHPPQEPR